MKLVFYHFNTFLTKTVTEIYAERLEKFLQNKNLLQIVNYCHLIFHLFERLGGIARDTQRRSDY